MNTLRANFGLRGALEHRLRRALRHRQTRPVAPPLVLHLLPVDLSRGAQTYARELRLALDGTVARHRTLTLFASEGGALLPDRTLGVTPGLLRRAGIDPRALVRLRQVVRSEAPAAVVAHGSEPLKYAVLAGVPRSRLVYYKIGIGGTRLAGAKGWFHRRLVARVSKVAVVSDDAAREALGFGVPPNDLEVIPNGRDPAGYDRRRPAAPGAAVRLVFVGHMTESKRPRRFVELVSVLRGQGVAVVASMAGDGPLLGAVRSAGVDAGVDVLGEVDDVAGLLGAGDVLVFTSVAEGEGMPGVLIEAGMAGLAAVTTDVPGASSVIDHGNTGFVVPVDDFDALVRATRSLVVDSELRERLGAAARARCESRFSLEASARQWRALLAEMTGDACASST
jgi:glycosyltransferase involved in cell wall biosynthesis